MVRRLGEIVSQVFRRIVPDPLVIAVLLTIVVLIAALLAGTYPETNDSGEKIEGLVGQATYLLDTWRTDAGLWKLLSFAMEMCLILLGGYVLADARPIRHVLKSIASLPSNGPAAAAMIGVVAALLGLLNWGLGLIGGAVLARETGRSLHARGIPAHYPLLAAAGYMGLLVWHGGFSGSAPLSMTTEKGAARVLPTSILADTPTIPLSETIFSPLNLMGTGGLLVLIPFLLAAMSPRASDRTEITDIEHFLPTAKIDSAPRHVGVGTMADFLNGSRLISTLLGLAFLAAAIRGTWLSGIDRMGLDEVIMYLLAAAAVLHDSPRSMMESAARAAAGCAGIIVQFPLYAGIMGLMVASGLIISLTNGMLELAAPHTLGIWTMLSAGVVNLMVPSGGGQWAVQGPIALQAAMESGIAPGRLVMSVAWGDQLTNMLQPFWALPLLAVTGVRARDIVGYTAVVMVAATSWLVFCLAITA